MPKQQEERLMPLLIDVQSKLDDEIKLESLASRFGSSPFHFHRVFSDVVGETPRKHVQRLRLERAATLLAVTDEPILGIGLTVGFKSAETFSRNFKRFIGYTPSGYRRMAKIAQAERVRSVDFFLCNDYRLSRAQFVDLPATPLLAMRQVGDYGKLNESFGRKDHPWHALTAWACREEVSIDPVFIGLFYDDPTMTPAAMARCDVCVPVNGEAAATSRVRCIRFERGRYAVAEYVGRVGTLLNAFQGVADEVRRSGTHTFRDGPAVEFLRTPNVNGEAGVHHIGVAFPVKRIDGRRGRKQESSR
jgi:AraC family transcriptional regulator